jgi:hypothetical protein
MICLRNSDLCLAMSNRSDELEGVRAQIKSVSRNSYKWSRIGFVWLNSMIRLGSFGLNKTSQLTLQDPLVFNYTQQYHFRSGDLCLTAMQCMPPNLRTWYCSSNANLPVEWEVQARRGEYVRMFPCDNIYGQRWYLTTQSPTLYNTTETPTLTSPTESPTQSPESASPTQSPESASPTQSPAVNPDSGSSSANRTESPFATPTQSPESAAPTKSPTLPKSTQNMTVTMSGGVHTAPVYWVIPVTLCVCILLFGLFKFIFK